MVDRRKFKRLEIPVSLVIKLLGTVKHPQAINAETRNISREGLLIEQQVMLRNGSLLIQGGEKTIKMIPFLVLNEKLVQLDIEIPPRGDKIRATGRVRWYDFGLSEKSYYFRAGIVLEEMEIGDRKKWEDFVRSIAQARAKERFVGNIKSLRYSFKIFGG